MSTPAARGRAPKGTPGQGAYGSVTPGLHGASTFTTSQLKAGVHLRSLPAEPTRRGDTNKPMLAKALAFRLKQHPSTRAFCVCVCARALGSPAAAPPQPRVYPAPPLTPPTPGPPGP